MALKTMDKHPISYQFDKNNFMISMWFLNLINIHGDLTNQTEYMTTNVADVVFAVV